MGQLFDGVARCFGLTIVNLAILPSNATPTRVPTARGLQLAKQLATDCPAELLAGYRG
jgi:hypothetical protein